MRSKECIPVLFLVDHIVSDYCRRRIFACVNQIILINLNLFHALSIQFWLIISHEEANTLFQSEREKDCYKLISTGDGLTLLPFVDGVARNLHAMELQQFAEVLQTIAIRLASFFDSLADHVGLSLFLQAVTPWTDRPCRYSIKLFHSKTHFPDETTLVNLSFRSSLKSSRSLNVIAPSTSNIVKL